MLKKKIFSKKKSKIKYIYIIFLIILLILTINFIISLNYNREIIIEKNIANYYIIPKDKKGLVIPNINKRILEHNKNSDEDFINNFKKNKFTIQLYASPSYEEIVNKHNSFLKNISILNDDLFIMVLKHNLGIDYLLVYKSFNIRGDAYNYCTKYLKLIKNCLIINVQNFD